MAWTNTFDTTTPDGATQPGSVLDDEIQTVKKAIQERLNGNDIYFPLTGTQVSDTSAGKHRKVTFYGVLSAKPTLLATECALYIKTVSGKSELFFENEDGTELQLTTLGKFNASGTTIPDDTIDDGMILLAYNAYLKGTNSAGTGETNLIKSGRNEADDADAAVLPDLARLATNAAPTEDTQLPNKKYVDDAIAAQGIFASGATVFNAAVTAANTWQDLDLSAQVGANTALVFLEITGNNTINFAVKPKGYGSGTSTNHLNIPNSGCAQGQIILGHYFYVTCMTNSSGIVQIAASSGTPSTVTIKLIGYIK
jgi:hypothetical protein